MGIGSAINVVSTGMRHTIDQNVTFGMAGNRFNQRDHYRRDYSDAQRVSAGVGTALGTALPLVTGKALLGRSFEGVSIAPKVLNSSLGRAAAFGALGIETYVGAKRLTEVTQDDGHFGAVGTTAGIVGGMGAGLFAGRGLGRMAPLASGAGALIGGVAGHIAGSHIDAGPGHIGEEHVQGRQVDNSALDRARSFGRGMVNHFTEVGPTTTGISLGYRWGMGATVQGKYSNAELDGGMHGDLIAAGILGGGALAVAGIAARGTQNGASGLRNAAEAATAQLDRSVVMRAANDVARQGTALAGHLPGAGGVAKALPALGAAAAITALTVGEAYSQGSDEGGKLSGLAWGGGTAAAAAGTALAISRSSALKGMAAAPRAGSSTLAAAALIGLMSSARLPINQFVSDAKVAHAASGGTDWTVSGPAAGIMGAGGGYGALKVLNRIVPDSGFGKVPKVAVVGIGTVIGGVAAGGAGFGLSATMPDLKTTGLSTVGGAAAGLAVAGVARKVSAPAGMIAGSLVGMTAASIVQDDHPRIAVDATSPEAIS